MSPKKAFDFIVFGATGYTGKYCIEYLVKCLQTEKKAYRWAIAGRNEGKLIEARNEVAALINTNLDHIPIVVADVSDENSLVKMCEQCNVLLNGVGPYRLYGEPVIKACIKAKTHQVDIAGEPQYLENLQMKYHKEAEEAGVVIANACGFDSIPCDVGIRFLKEKIKPRVLNSVESYVKFQDGDSGNVINHGTWDSAVEAFANYHELPSIRRRLFTEFFTKPMPSFKYPISQGFLPFYSDVVKQWCVPFWETDKAVVKRTQLFNYINYGERPTQLTCYMGVPNFLMIFGFAIVGLIFLIMTRCAAGVRLLHQYPRLFTFGAVSEVGPTREQVLGSSFKMFLVGKSWKEGEEDKSPPVKKSVVVISGGNPAYVATSIIMILAGFSIHEEYLSDRMPFKGGVFTPGVLFRKSDLIERLNRNSVVFQLLSNDD